MNRILILILMAGLFLHVLTPHAHAGGTLVITDSIGAQGDSWPALIREWTGENIQVMGQNRRTIRDFTLPNDLRADTNIDTVIYTLGANDAFGGTSDRILADRVLGHLRLLKDRGFRVIVVKVPVFPHSQKDVNRVNSIIVRKARGLKLQVINLDPVWDVRLTADTVHPLPELSYIIADYILERL